MSIGKGVLQDSERYLFFRVDSIFSNFFNIFKDMLGLGVSGDCLDFTSNLLYSLARSIGKQSHCPQQHHNSPLLTLTLSFFLGRSHARNFKSKTGLDTHITVAAGFEFFAYCGWGFVDIAPESKIIDRYYTHTRTPTRTSYIRTLTHTLSHVYTLSLTFTLTYSYALTLAYSLFVVVMRLL